jgi:uncharacterized membrane protein YdjX (TVP38/TMEM64 family)
MSGGMVKQGEAPGGGMRHGPDGDHGPGRARRWLLLAVAVFALILVPFVLFEASITGLVADMVSAARGHVALVALIIIAILVADVLLPVPSSLVSGLAGATLGFWGGTLAIWIGMTGGCLLGYWLGRGAGHVAMRRVVGPAETERAREMLAGAGAVALVVTRAVPVLAEAMVLGAGAARMPLAPFLLLTGAANLAVALAYAAVGALALAQGSFLLFFLGLAILPTASWLLWLKFRT